MGWITRTPSQDRIDFWRGKVQGGHKVAWWPHPNTIRIDPRYRMKYTVPAFIPVASRWGFYYRPFLTPWDPDTPEVNAFGWMDMQVVAVDHLHGEMGLNEHGYDLEVDIKVEEDLPLHSQPGIEMSIDITRPGLPVLKQRGEFVAQGAGLPLEWNEDTVRHGPTPVFYWKDVDPPEQRIDIVQCFGVQECYGFPEEDVGMASFNGTDAYIQLGDLGSFPFNPFKISCEVRLNQTANHWPVLGRDGAGGFCGMRDDNIVFGSFEIDTSWTPVTDVWLPWVFEFEWPDLLKYKLTIAGTEVWNSVQVRQNFPMDTIGVYKHGIAGTLWADLDMRDLKIETGSPSSPVVLLDMPLRANALDLGPQENHGTTFNMDLPSV